jgi:hypothetical protein
MSRLTDLEPIYAGMVAAWIRRNQNTRLVTKTVGPATSMRRSSGVAYCMNAENGKRNHRRVPQELHAGFTFLSCGQTSLFCYQDHASLSGTIAASAISTWLKVNL